ncbi:phosphodiesterase [Acidovorax sp. HDW3]|uniref:alkaline phosphatase D family protein n=1 Tax=Acidovorax sp. HDW3 TaxID=2714923 RepID=UPI00140E631D|nr:alkaline phosphatase D family protein [Acidovorax sp. HDW3]QIL43579.1 phosphodiesterase [Acidovorax sp. HDW3]
MTAIDRRQFLKFSSFFTTSAAALGLGAGLAGCGGGSSDGDAGGAWKFPQSIASADPRPDSIVLWTRVVPAAFSDTTALASGSDAPLRLCVTAADNEALLGGNQALTGALVADVALTAYGAYDGTVRHKLTGLAAGRTYYYQFSAGGTRSRVGRFKTAPAADSDLAQLRFACFTCQDWSVNHWAAYEHLLSDAPVDFFLHLGDYIYETVGADFQKGQVEARHTPLQLPDGSFVSGTSGARYASSLNDYRYLYKQYRSDARLQAVHERFAMIAIWDDHEFSDDCWQDAQTYDKGSYDAATGQGDNVHQSARRIGANRAWYEFMPADVRFDASSNNIFNIQIYRDFTFGKLAHLVMTDERLYRSDHVVHEAMIGGSIGARYMVPQGLLAGLEAQKMAAAGNSLDKTSMLGGTQRAWWKKQMQAGSRWKLWGNEVSLLRMGINGTDAMAALLALNAMPVLAASIASTAASSTGGNVALAAAVVAASTAGASQAVAAAAAQAVAAAVVAQRPAAAQGAGLTAAQAQVVAAAYDAALAAQAAGAQAQAGAGAQAIAVGWIQPDIRQNKAQSRFVVESGKAAALGLFFQNFILNADQWDGYNAERKELMRFLADNAIGNVVALTGDIHSFFAGTVSTDFDAAGGGQPVMVDLVTAGVSSDSFFTYLKDQVGSLSSDLAPLVYYPLDIATGTQWGTVRVNVNLLDYTMGAARNLTVDDLVEQVRVQVRAALAQAGVPAAQLDALAAQLLQALKADTRFNTDLLLLAQQLAGLNSNPWLKYCCTDAQGYMVVTVTPDALTSEQRQVHRLLGTQAPQGQVLARVTKARVAQGVVGVNLV